MIVKKFNELDTTHLNFCRSLEVLNRIDFMDNLPSIVESVYGSTELSISVFDGGNDFTVRMNGHRHGAINVRVNKDSDPGGKIVSLYFSPTRLLSAISTNYEAGRSTEDSYIFLNDRVIFEDGTIVTYENLKENAFQYSTICHLAALIRQYANVE